VRDAAVVPERARGTGEEWINRLADGWTCLGGEMVTVNIRGVPIEEGIKIVYIICGRLCNKI
jgi:hypothetical protein